MALNPPINREGRPMRVEGEYFVLERKDIEIEAIIENGGKRTGKGKLFVTTARLVFVNKNHEKEAFKAFDIPIFNILEEKFEQPIFGANYLYLKVKPLHNLLPGNTKVKLWFMSGGVQKFLKYFVQILQQVRSSRSRQPDSAFIKHLSSGTLEKHLGYVDPSDPTVIFVSQPVDDFSNKEMQNYYGYSSTNNMGIPSQSTTAYTSPQQPQGMFGNTIPSSNNSQYPQPTNAYGSGAISQGQPICYAPPMSQATNNQYPDEQQQQQLSYPTFSSFPQQQQQYPSSIPTMPGSGTGIMIGGGGIPTQQVPYQTGMGIGATQQVYPSPTNTYPSPSMQQEQPQTQVYPGPTGIYPSPTIQQQQPLVGSQQQQQPPIGSQQQQQANNPNVGYYFGWWGPQLQNNTR